MSVLQSSFGGNVNIAGNCVVTAPGIYSGDGSGLTNLNIGGLSGTPGAYILADPNTGSLTSSTIIHQSPSGAITLNTPAFFHATSGTSMVFNASGALALQSPNIELQGPVIQGTMTQQVMNTTTPDATPVIMFSQIIPAVGGGQTKAIKFYITANNLDTPGVGAIYEGILKAFAPAIAGALTLSATVVENQVVDAGFAGINFTVTSIGANQLDVTVTGLAATNIQWNGIMYTY